jgi:hypothetical protein
MSLDVNDFKAKFSGGARPNRFRVLISFPGYAGGDTEETSFMVKAASMPGVQSGEINVAFRGRQIPYPGDKTFEPWNVTVLNDIDFSVRNALVAWHNGINDNATNSSDQPIDSWFSDIIVEQLGLAEGEVLKRYKLHGAYPQTVGEISLDNESGDQIETFESTFRFLYWTEA